MRISKPNINMTLKINTCHPGAGDLIYKHQFICHLHDSDSLRYHFRLISVCQTTIPAGLKHQLWQNGATDRACALLAIKTPEFQQLSSFIFLCKTTKWSDCKVCLELYPTFIDMLHRLGVAFFSFHGHCN